MSTQERDRIILELLREDRLIIREIKERIEAERDDLAIFEEWVRNRVMRLYKQGQLEREGENWRSKTRYRYFRRQAEAEPERETVEA